MIKYEEYDLNLYPLKASELRIGNIIWAIHEESESIVTVDADWLKIQVEYEIDRYADQFARGWWFGPTPLTAALLFKLSKSQRHFHDGVVIYEFGIFEFWQQGENIWLHREFKEWLPLRIDFVHQLQNLYFVLTNTELTLTPSPANNNLKKI